MISVEKRKDNEEIVLSFDKNGAEYLLKIIKNMIKEKVDTAEHLYTKEWAGNELSSDVNFQDGTLVNMLTLFYLSDSTDNY